MTAPAKTYDRKAQNRHMSISFLQDKATGSSLQARNNRAIVVPDGKKFFINKI
jgi:hypothetical protein